LELKELCRWFVRGTRFSPAASKKDSRSFA
jgi:hypothetical protein